MSLTEKTHKATGRSKRPASFHIFVSPGNCPANASGGQPDALLTTHAYRRAGACSHRKHPQILISHYLCDIISSQNLNLAKEGVFMKKYISRTNNRVALVLLLSFVFLLLVGCLLSNGIIMLSSLALLISGFILMLSANRCPYCGEYFRGLYWSKSNAGHCRKCGKIIEFDDNVN